MTRSMNSTPFQCYSSRRCSTAGSGKNRSCGYCGMSEFQSPSRLRTTSCPRSRYTCVNCLHRSNVTHRHEFSSLAGIVAGNHALKGSDAPTLIYDTYRLKTGALLLTAPIRLPGLGGRKCFRFFSGLPFLPAIICGPWRLLPIVEPLYSRRYPL